MGILDFSMGDRYIGEFYKDAFDGDGKFVLVICRNVWVQEWRRF